jgi:hypothetical protein
MRKLRELGGLRKLGSTLSDEGWRSDGVRVFMVVSDIPRSLVHLPPE